MLISACEYHGTFNDPAPEGVAVSVYSIEGATLAAGRPTGAGASYSANALELAQVTGRADERAGIRVGYEKKARDLMRDSGVHYLASLHGADTNGQRGTEGWAAYAFVPDRPGSEPGTLVVKGPEAVDEQFGTPRIRRAAAALLAVIFDEYPDGTRIIFLPRKEGVETRTPEWWRSIRAVPAVLEVDSSDPAPGAFGRLDIVRQAIEQNYGISTSMA